MTIGVRFTHLVDELADRTGVGEALAGAVLLGAVTSLPGLVTTITGAASGQADFAVSNAIGGIAAQTTFLVLADLAYRRVNLEHAAASLPNLVQTLLLLAMIGVVLVAVAGPEIAVLWLHPASVVLVVMYVYGLLLTQRVREQPMWRPRTTSDTVVDEPDTDGSTSRSLRSLWLSFAWMAATVGVLGYLVGRAGISVMEATGMSGSLVGGLFTSVITSLPELITVLTAVRIGATTLAVSDIVGGNTFDVLFIAAADLFFTGGSVYHDAGAGSVLLLALTVLLVSLLAAGLVTRERRFIGFEGIAILVAYAAGVVALFFI